jgi:hypothetical protein
MYLTRAKLLEPEKGSIREALGRALFMSGQARRARLFVYNGAKVWRKLGKDVKELEGEGKAMADFFNPLMNAE